MMKRALLLILLLSTSGCFFAQEFNCMVSVSTPKIEGSDKQIFETLQSAIYEFINNRKWTNYNLKVEERLECTVLLTINERIGTDEFQGNLNLVLRRPILNTAYNSVLLNYVDKGISFRYTEFQPLDYSDGTFTSNLTSILAYYSYIFLGLYFDSFSPYGGTPFFEKAQEVVNAAQNASESGWKAFENEKNRWWLVNNYVSPANAALRDFGYTYNRLGLDRMYEKVDQGRNSITESLGFIQKLYNAKPGLFALQLIFDAKRDEFINIYSDQRVSPSEKTTVTNLLKEVDPANSSKYQVILEGK